MVMLLFSSQISSHYRGLWLHLILPFTYVHWSHCAHLHRAMRWLGHHLGFLPVGPSFSTFSSTIKPRLLASARATWPKLHTTQVQNNKHLGHLASPTTERLEIYIVANFNLASLNLLSETCANSDNVIYKKIFCIYVHLLNFFPCKIFHLLQNINFILKWLVLQFKLELIFCMGSVCMLDNL